MRLRTFTASDMPGAMAQVREALGDDAVILSSVTDKANRRVTVTAALEEAEEIRAPKPAAPKKSAPEEDLLEQLTATLRFHNTPEALAGRLLYKARQIELQKFAALQKLAPSAMPHVFRQQALGKLLEQCYRFAPLPPRAGLRMLLTGPAGAGKTIAIAKLATRMAMDGAPVVVATTDTKRAGGVAQLSAFTEILELPLQVLETPYALTALAQALPAGASLLVDTAGCNPFDAGEMNELADWIAAADIEPVLAMPAGIDSLEAADMVRRFVFPRIERLLVTRLDTARRLGALLAAAEARRLAFAHFTDSPRAGDPLKPLGAADLAQRLQQAMLQEPV